MSRNTLKTAVTTLEIIDFVAENSPVKIEAIAGAMDLEKSTAYGYLNSLAECNYVVKDGSDFKLSLKFLSLRQRIVEENPAFDIAERYTDRTAEETGYRALFAVEEYGQGVIISSTEGDYPEWPHERIGGKFSLHTTAAGKVLLAHPSTNNVTEIIEQWGLPQQTQQSITTVEQLQAELQSVRETGIAYNREEYIKGVAAVAVPVESPSGNLIGALAANAPINQIDTKYFENDVPEILSEIAEDFAEEVGALETE